MNFQQAGIARSQEAILATNKVLKNTYLLLSATLIFSGITAAVSMAVNPPMFTGLICSIVSMVILFFVLPRFANSSAGLGIVFLVTGLLGFGLGPILNAYVSAGAGSIVMTALGGTGAIFLGLSGYVLTTRKDFSFLAGFLMAGILVALLAGIGAMLFGMSGLMLAVSAMIVLLMSGMILYQTSEIIHGGETNYIMATVGLYISIYNLFTALLHLLGALGGDD